jgi:hypothetical protein
VFNPKSSAPSKDDTNNNDNDNDIFHYTTATPVSVNETAHTAGVTCLAQHPISPHYFVTGLK